ncbi:hypothetical protein [Pseudomonas phage vB_Pa-PAC2]
MIFIVQRLLYNITYNKNTILFGCFNSGYFLINRRSGIGFLFTDICMKRIKCIYFILYISRNTNTIGNDGIYIKDLELLRVMHILR